MSILKNKRTLSHLQYCQSFLDLYNNVLKVMVFKIPKRRMEFIAKPIIDCMNKAYSYITAMANYYNRKDGLSDKEKYVYTKNAINAILSLQSPLFVYWNIPTDDNIQHHTDKDGRHYTTGYKRVTEKRRKDQVDAFNYELVLLYGVLKKNPLYDEAVDNVNEFLIMYKNSDIMKAEFLKAIQSLHRYCHKEVIKMNKMIRDTDGALLIKHSNAAWYYALKGNNVFVTNKDTYYIRKRYFSLALTNLKQLDIPMRSVFSIMDYSEKQIECWIKMLTTAEKLMEALLKEESTRYIEFVK